MILLYDLMNKSKIVFVAAFIAMATLGALVVPMEGFAIDFNNNQNQGNFNNQQSHSSFTVGGRCGTCSGNVNAGNLVP